MQEVDKKNTEISDRFNLMIHQLGLNANAFAKALGYDRSQAIYDIIKGKSSPSFDFFVRLKNSEFAGIFNLDWIITGEGEMLSGRSSVYADQETVRSTAQGSSKLGEGIPLIPANALAGTGAGELVITEHDIEQRYVIPEFAKAEFLIRVKGSSMYPKYNAGDLLACKRVSMNDFVQWNKTYVLDTTQGIMVKRIVKGKSSQYWILRSDNKDYQDIEVEPAIHVRSISLVVGVIRLE